MLLLESISVKNNIIQNLPFHQLRFDQSRKFFFDEVPPINLKNHIFLPQDNIWYKCRILYQSTIEKVELVPYTLRPIQSLQLVLADEVDYPFKYADRSPLLQLLAKKGEADEILIVKNGQITDTSYSNIVFWDGAIWWTPDRPLLEGTRRAKYLKEGKIKAKAIKVTDLRNFKGAKIINAMIGLEDTMMMSMENIKAI